MLNIWISHLNFYKKKWGITRSLVNRLAFGFGSLCFPTQVASGQVLTLRKGSLDSDSVKTGFVFSFSAVYVYIKRG